MTHDRDFERLLDNWLTDGPTVVADRVIDDVAARIVRQPQRPAWRLRTWRITPMTSTIRFAGAAAAIVLAIAGVAVLAIPRASGPGGPQPSPTPSPTPTPSPIAFRADAHLVAGTYAAQLDTGRLTFTLPTGWSSADVSRLDFTLHLDGGLPNDTVKVFTDMHRASKDAACTETPASGVGVAADLLAQDLGADPNLVVQSGGPIALDAGLQGQSVDVTLASSATKTCPFSSGQPSVPLIVDAIPGEGAFWGIGPKERIRLVILDAPGGHNVVIAVDSADGTSFDALVGATMPIVQSMQFTAR